MIILKKQKLVNVEIVFDFYMHDLNILKEMIRLHLKFDK
jgi:hypothetical protein